MNRLLLAFCLCLGLSISTDAVAACKKCKDVGYTKEFVECYLCKGEKNVLPNYYKDIDGMPAAFVYPCPLCRKSKHIGQIHSLTQCDCGKNLNKLNRENFFRFNRLLRPFKIKIGVNVSDDDFYWTRLIFESRNNWLMDKNNKEKILRQAARGEYDLGYRIAIYDLLKAEEKERHYKITYRNVFYTWLKEADSNSVDIVILTYYAHLNKYNMTSKYAAIDFHEIGRFLECKPEEDVVFLGGEMYRESYEAKRPNIYRR